VVTGKPGGMLHRIVQSASGVLAYFAGVPLAFAFIAALGAEGVVTVLLKHIGINLYADGFTITSMLGVGLATCTSRSR
jgi:putative spermidine/putrescine transport system permease protein